MIRKFKTALLLLSIVCISHTTLSAQKRTVTEAQAIAIRFYREQQQLHTKTRSATTELKWVQPATRSTEDPLLYTFATDNDGFVIVSADERAHTILGYSLNGTFSYNSLPTPLQVLLNNYETQLKQLPSIKVTTDSTHKYAPVTRATYQGVAPLLGSIEWNQDAPFNLQCPTDPVYSSTTPAGCVAIAAAQIMKFHRHPEKGSGKRSYTTTTNRIGISVSYEGTIYDWDNMLNSYNYGYNDTQANAVAELCYHIGSACRTDYCYEGSGATAKDIANALKQNFGYDDDLEYIDRTYFTEPVWEQMLRDELDAGRPILHFGEGPTGGHAFVCDGYDSEGLFHYNWGWGGTSDGYFRSAALEPTVLGIGSGAGCYNYLQSALTQIQPPTENSTHIAHLHLSRALSPGATTVTNGTETKITASFYNCGLRQFTGEAAIALYSASGGNEPICILASKALTRIPELTGGTSGTAFKFTIPDTLTNGTYQLYLVHKEEGTNQYIKMNAPVTIPNYLIVTKSTGTTTITQPAYHSKLSLTAKPKVENPLYHNRKGTFSLTVRNDGEEFYSYLGVLLQKRNTTPVVRQYVGVILTRIPKGATRTFTFTTDAIDVEAGNYDVVAVCDSSNSSSSYLTPIGPDELMVTQTTIQKEPALAPNFRLTGAMTIAPIDGSTTISTNEQFTVNAKITNMGGYADGKFAVVFFNRAEEMIGNSNIVEASVGSLKTAELTITHRLNQPAGQYAAILTSVSGDEATAIYPAEYNAITFTLTEATEINSPSHQIDTYIHNSPQTRTLQIRAERPITTIRITDTSGHTIYTSLPQYAQTHISTCEWEPSIYIIGLTTETGKTETHKIQIQ